MTRQLADFLLEPGVYRLGQYSPVSIRDQVVRANYLVEHLAASGELAQTTRLLVLGAGAAGVMATVAAVRRGVADVTLVEKSGTVMPLQARTQTRWLDPVQYDWPAGQWAMNEWPVPETGSRRFTAVSAPFPPLRSAIAEDWALNFQNRAAKTMGSAVKTLYHTEAGMWFRSLPGFSVPLTNVNTGAKTTIDADLIIFAAGFGTEHAAVPDATNPPHDFWGLDFWSPDKFELPDMGITARTNGVLVSGGGDGALQDFVRLTTGLRSVGDIMVRVWATTDEFTEWKQQFMNVWHWEDHANRSRGYAPHPLAECDLLRRLHARHQDAVEALTASSEWTTVADWFDERLSNRAVGSVFLALKCDHFGWCYGLNRSVALILLEYLKRRKVSVLKTHVAVQSTEHVATTHPCGHGCWGHKHRVHLAQNVSCATSDDDIKSSKDTKPELYDGLVIRHGIDPLKFGPFVFDKLKPQVVPFHLP